MQITSMQDIDVLLGRLASWDKPTRLRMLATAKQRLLAFRRFGNVSSDDFIRTRDRIIAAKQETLHGRR
jgi:hypothetical protein